MTFPAGSRILAEDLATITTPVEELDDAWLTWTPTLTAITIGTGGVTIARYKKVGRLVNYRLRITLGTSPTIGTSPKFTLPVAPVSSPAYVGFADPLGRVALGDTGTGTRPGEVFISSGSTCEIYSWSGTNVLQLITATVPHTWAATDTIGISGVYESNA